jgi:hypothetical protein
VKRKKIKLELEKNGTDYATSVKEYRFLIVSQLRIFSVRQRLSLEDLT